MRAGGIASVGECMLELSGRDDSDWRMNHAGDAFNTLWAIRALVEDRQHDFISAFGDDPFSQQQRRFFSTAKIGVGSSPVIAGARPGLYAITLDGAERSFTYWRADSAARHLAEDAEALKGSFKDRALIYFSGITLAILGEAERGRLLSALEDARSAGALIAFDPNYRPRLWKDAETARAAIAPALALTDIALPTFPDEAALYGDDRPAATAERIAAAGVGEIVVKDGEQPALVVNGAERLAVPAMIVETPVDTTGAGDSFNGGYLAARILGLAPKEAAERAHKVAARVVQTRGALAPFEAIRAAFG